MSTEGDPGRPGSQGWETQLTVAHRQCALIVLISCSVFTSYTIHIRYIHIISYIITLNQCIKHSGSASVDTTYKLSFVGMRCHLKAPCILSNLMCTTVTGPLG